MKVHFDNAGAKILNSNGVVDGKATHGNNLYQLTAYFASEGVNTSKLWHERFGHLSLIVLKEMLKYGLVVDLSAVMKLPDACEACMMGGQATSAPLPTRSKHS